MKYLYSCQTDIGATRSVNQDALVIKCREYSGRRILMAAVCDGVGGLKQGEVTSRRTAELLSQWFDYELPQLMARGDIQGALRFRIQSFITDMNQRIYYEDRSRGISSGTTLSLLLIWEQQYLICQVGDSRIYCIDQETRQLTRDQSLIQREIENGRLTKSQAASDPRRNVILQCIGAREELQPDFYEGYISRESVFILCTDGFWHYMADGEWIENFSPAAVKHEQQLYQSLTRLIRCMIGRGEMDNITAVAVKVY